MEMDFKQLAQAIKVIAEEKNLPEDQVQDVVQQALAAAWRRDYGDREQEVRVTMNLNTGEVTAYITKEIVNEVENLHTQISLSEAQVMRKNAKVGETVEIVQPVEDFGRVAAQTAKQVILQRLREAEREIVLAEYEDKIGGIVNGVVTRVEGRIVRVELGRAQGILPVSEQIQGERPVGTFVGGHGTRINAVRDEIGNQEMIDIVVWNDDPATFIANAMKPANVARVELKGEKATVVVPEDQLSIAIGKSGQNVRLAGKLTGHELDVEADKGEAKEKKVEPGVESKPVVQKLKKKSELESSLLEAIEEHSE
jgi:transcription antitermination factor NusA-like protein